MAAAMVSTGKPPPRIRGCRAETERHTDGMPHAGAWARLLPFLILAVLTPWAARAQATVAQVQERAVQPTVSAYAMVEPIATLSVPALLDGRLEGWRVTPGMRVGRGQLLGRLGGPEHAKEEAVARAEKVRAGSTLAFARKSEAVVRQTYPAISDLQKLLAAQATVATAEAALQAASARWTALEAGSQVRAPASGTVTEVLAGNHQQVMAGAILLRLQDPGQLWLRAEFYGAQADRLKPGMRGTFQPLGGGAPVPVRIRSVFPSSRPGGGRTVGCDNTGPAGWVGGEAGTLRLEEPSLSGPAVPEAALILDGARWFVVVQVAQGFVPREVTPAAGSDGWRLISKGLKTGETVVVRDAYLVFHRDVAKSFAPPD